MKQLFILDKLPLETHVWKNYWSSFAGIRECLLEVHLFVLHQEGDDTGSTSRYTSVTVHEDASLLHSFFHKCHGCREMADQTA
jgi:hypothetical protein